MSLFILLTSKKYFSNSNTGNYYIIGIINVIINEITESTSLRIMSMQYSYVTVCSFSYCVFKQNNFFNKS